MSEFNNDTFNFFVPIELEKSGTGKSEKMKIKGIASTGDKDSQDETLIPSGFDLKRFIDQGFLNYNHLSKSDPSMIVGEPTVAKITRDGKLYIEGDLYADSPLAKKVWDLGKMLEKSGSKRRLGFSIEGRAVERDILDPKIVRKAEITGCAITPTPVNTNTLMELVKGNVTEIYKPVTYEFSKSLEGTDIIMEGVDKETNTYYCINKDLDIISKSMDSVNTKAITKEDLEGVKQSMYKAIVTLSKAYKQGLLSEDQIGEFKKSLDTIKNQE